MASIIGTSGNDTINAGAGFDIIEGSNDDDTLEGRAGSETLLLQGVTPAQMTASSQLFSAGIPCFTTGTMIRTPHGDVRIEELAIGDLVCTLDNGPQPLRWIMPHWPRSRCCSQR
jgi:Ca2+-binding RTX toxin-like protein